MLYSNHCFFLHFYFSLIGFARSFTSLSCPDEVEDFANCISLRIAFEVACNVVFVFRNFAGKIANSNSTFGQPVDSLVSGFHICSYICNLQFFNKLILIFMYVLELPLSISIQQCAPFSSFLHNHSPSPSNLTCKSQFFNYYLNSLATAVTKG